MSPNSPTTKRLVLQCPDNCSLRPDAIGGAITAALVSMRENGAGKGTMAARAAELLGRPVPETNMQRHLHHFRELASDEPEEDGPRPNDVAILDAIIAAGFRNQRSWRPTIKDTLDAIKLKTQMTGQSAFEDMLAAMSEGLDLAEEGTDEEEEQAPENREALLSPDERVTSDGDD